MKFQNWKYSFRESIKKFQDRKFEWGSSDCFQFAGAMIQSMTGDNPIIDLYMTYDTKKRAYEILEERGGTEKFWTDLLGESIPVNNASHGDLVLLNEDFGNVVGVIAEGGVHIWVMTLKDGIIRIGIENGVMSWRV